MTPATIPAKIAGMSDEPAAISTAVGAGLGFGSALCYVLLRAGYASALVDAGAYDYWVGVVVWGSVLVGVGASAVLAYAGVSGPVAVTVGAAPAIGLITGSAIAVVGGLGSYDSSPVALAVGFLLGCGVHCGTGWLVGYVIRWQVQ